MYKIEIGKKPGSDILVHLDGKNPTAVPKSVMIGTGDKKKRYLNHLSKCFESDNKDLLRFLAYVHWQGKEKGDIGLICHCQFHRWHGQAVKEFIEEHQHTFDMMLPYLFPHLISEAWPKESESSGAAQPTESDEPMIVEPIETSQSNDSPDNTVIVDGFKMNPEVAGRLSKTDLAQFSALIQKDRETRSQNTEEIVTPQAVESTNQQ